MIGNNLIFLLVVIIFIVSQIGQAIIIHTPLGQIRGTTLTTRYGKTIHSFLGIRYGLPPIGGLRFRPPKPTKSWKGIYDATKDAPACPQPPTGRPSSEDCLFLNVYTTNLHATTPSQKLKSSRNWKSLDPVIVNFEVGRFSSGSGASNIEGPQYLLDQPVVLVTTNYRLGALGFISTGDEEAQGNYGLKDQVLILKWVKKNIASFGGDPSLVTIMGYGGGGACVTTHLVSPMSRNLFHRAIAMSGSIFGNWPVETNHLELAKRQARLVNCPDHNSKVIIDCLRTKSAEDLGNTADKFTQFGLTPDTLWLPVIEHDLGPKNERFLPDHPLKLLENNTFAKNIPIITGVTQDEFAFHSYDVLANDTITKEFNVIFEKVAPVAFCFEQNSNFSVLASQQLKNYYFGNESISNLTANELGYLFADGLAGFGVHQTAKFLSTLGNRKVYYYQFSYRGTHGHFSLPNTNKTFVVHHDDLIYLFYIKIRFPEIKLGDPDGQIVDKLTTMWANFAKTGNPTPQISNKLDNITWTPFAEKTPVYLKIGKKLSLQVKMYEKRYNTWENIYSQK